MAIIIGVGILFYILSWAHAIMRLRTGGKPGSPYEAYCCDPKVTADKWSALGIVWGTVILFVIAASLS